jgi:hypothetical protein
MLHGPRDILDKLHFDLDRLQEASKISRTASTYAAFDCAVAAWSLVDWTYEYLLEHDVGTLQQKFHAQSKNDFIKFVKIKMPTIEACRLIAVGAKHFVISYGGEADIHTSVVTAGRPFRAGDRCGTPLKTWEHWPSIIWNGEPCFADDLFADVWLQWHLLFHEHNIDVRQQSLEQKGAELD